MDLRPAVLPVSTLLFVFASCSGELSASENTRLAGQCTTGPAPYGDTHLPPRRAPVHYEDQATCAGRCGAPTLNAPNWGSSSPYDALPSGACTTGTHCEMRVSSTQTCGTETHPCDLSQVQCECEDDEWRCYLTSQGAGACGPCDLEPTFQLSADAGAR